MTDIDVWDLRYWLYNSVAATGQLPTRLEIAAWVGNTEIANQLIVKLNDRHLVVLDSSDEVHMALPFGSSDTGHRVHGPTVSWWANCAWDSLAIPVALGVDVDIEAKWLDTGEAVDLHVRNGELSSVDGYVHWSHPAHTWWDEITET